MKEKQKNDGLQSKREWKKNKKLAQQEKRKESRQRNKEIYLIGYILSGILVLMAGYFIYFVAIESENVLQNPLNNRTKNMAQVVVRGDIVSSDGVVLVTTKTNPDGTETREYVFRNLFAHPIGYSTMGTTGIEKSQNLALLTSNISFLENLKDEILGQKSQGDRVVLTLNSSLQNFCYNLLEGHKGSISVIEVKTGKVLAMVSRPDYDPNTVVENWQTLISEENKEGNLLNRVSQGLYAPGSTFKILTALEYMRENPDTWQNFSFTCTGVIERDGLRIACHDGHVHGTVDLKQALAQSCNGAFATLALEVDNDKLHKLCESVGFNEALSVDFASSKSKFVLTNESNEWETMQTGIGQGQTMITPLLDVMISAMVANDGKVLKPYLVDRIETYKGVLVKQYEPEEVKTVMTEEETRLLTEFMIAVINGGSGGQAASQYCQVAGKTGSAQYDSKGNLHAWFTGFAPADAPEIAVCVQLEGAGTGGDIAAPMAAQIFDFYFAQ